MITSFLRLLRRCYELALPYGRLRLFALLGLIFLNGLLQLVGVSSIFPFFALAADPDRIRNSTFGRWFLSFLPPMEANHLLATAGLFAIFMLFVASGGGIYSEVLRVRYAWGFAHWLRRQILESYARRPYSFFLSRNSAELYQKLWDVQTFTQSVLLPLGEILSKLVLVLLLVAGVFLVQPWVALGALVLLGGFYLAIFRYVRPKARAVGDAMQIHQIGLGKNAYQFLHGIKPVLVSGRSRHFISNALQHSRKIGEEQSKIPLYSNGPRYIIEPIALGGLVAIVVVMALQGRPFSDILPNLSVMALAAYRLLPALQLLFSQLVIVSSNNYTLLQVEAEVGRIENDTIVLENEPSALTKPMSFKEEIVLDNITFRYASGGGPILRSFTLRIPKNHSIGIAGPSGSGKSTLVDLLLGLHRPESGSIMVDGEQLTPSNLSSWRQLIGYVPQEIYMIDDTIAANIAFGIPLEKIDPVALREAAEGAQILDFIEALPESFETRIGERGVLLSGGQRQRIGLARALYHRPQVLILDEATSALDLVTESAVMETINRLQGSMTMITIAHRLSTLERCDEIVRMEPVQRVRSE